jgi:hypothetical protein
MVKTDAIAEATAIFRPTGNWSVHLGPPSVLPRVVRWQSDCPTLDRRMGMLASCAGALTMSALEERGINTHVLRVTAQRSRWEPSSNTPPRTVIKISVESEADQRMAQACCDARLRAHPLPRHSDHDGLVTQVLAAADLLRMGIRDTFRPGTAPWQTPRRGSPLNPPPAPRDSGNPRHGANSQRLS